jgi:hypothetical protein
MKTSTVIGGVITIGLLGSVFLAASIDETGGLTCGLHHDGQVLTQKPDTGEISVNRAWRHADGSSICTYTTGATQIAIPFKPAMGAEYAAGLQLKKM